MIFFMKFLVLLHNVMKWCICCEFSETSQTLKKLLRKSLIKVMKHAFQIQKTHLLYSLFHK